MNAPKDALTNHVVTICLQGGAQLGPYNATWSKETKSDIRELLKDYDDFLQTGQQQRFKYHLHDATKHVSHTLVLQFTNVTAIYDCVALSE